jgi:hypothetical protein
MEVKQVDVFGEFLLVVQQLAVMFQFYRRITQCFDMCFNIIASFAEFQIQPILSHKNSKANILS